MTKRFLSLNFLISLTMTELLMSPSPVSSESVPRFRAGAVAQMVRMPVATLRIWEQRYRLTAREVASSGHRLYSAADVQRIALLKQLSDLGHAIGTIAALDMEQLRQVAVTHVSTIATSAQALSSAPREPAPWRIAVVGVALAHRMQLPSLQRRLGRAPEVSGPFVSLAKAVEAQTGQGVDVLLVQAHGLHDASLAEFQAAASALGARRLAVFYGFARESVCQAFAAAGIALLREPQTDAALDEWLCRLHSDWPQEHAAPTPAALLGLVSPLGMAAGVVPPRRYDDATLANFAARSSTVACECPRHVVDLLMQLSNFETYSAECEHLSPADAELHAYLCQTSSAARHLFEIALERLAIHDGLALGT